MVVLLLLDEKYRFCHMTGRQGTIEFIGATPEAILLARPDSFAAKEVLFLIKNAEQFGYIRSATGWIKK